MDKYPLISVITPTYNRAGFLPETIESVLNQTYKNIEYIIVDDGSTDNTKEVVEPYLQDKRVKYYKHDNIGESKTTNKGYSFSNGELTIVVNSDDPLYETDYFEKAVKTFEENPDILAVYPNWVNTDINSNVISKVDVPQFDLLSMLLSSNVTLGPGMIIKKSALADIGFRNENIKYTGDLTISFKLAGMGKILHIDCYGVTHRNHAGCAQNDPAKQKEIANELLDLYLKIFNESPKDIPVEIKKNMLKILENACYVYKAYSDEKIVLTKLLAYRLIYINPFYLTYMLFYLKKHKLINLNISTFLPPPPKNKIAVYQDIIDFYALLMRRSLSAVEFGGIA